MDKHLGNPETCQLRDMNKNYWTLPAPRDSIDLICNAIALKLVPIGFLSVDNNLLIGKLGASPSSHL